MTASYRGKCLSVTEILHHFGDKEGLLYWAWKQGCDGFDFQQTRNRAAAFGSELHYQMGRYLESRAKRQKYVYVPSAELVRSGRTALLAKERMEAWIQWFEASKFRKAEILGNEIEMVSQTWGCAGTADLILQTTDSTLHILDLKTGSQVYYHNMLQVAAYLSMFLEQRPELKQCRTELHIVHLAPQIAVYTADEPKAIRTLQYTFEMCLRTYKLMEHLNAKHKSKTSKSKKARANATHLRH